MEKGFNAGVVCVEDMKKEESKIYFSNYFEISHKAIEEYGALDISLVCDNPAFVDPFLIFANPKYKEQHELIISYLKFLRDKTIKDSNNSTTLSTGDFLHYYKFPEIKQAWLGYSVDGNAGLGLGRDFADSLFRNLNKIFKNFGNETITQSPHLEKLCLIEQGIGIDKISDFTLNLIKKFILEYTQEFTKVNLDSKFIKEFAIKKSQFNFQTNLWEDEKFILPISPWNSNDYVLLVPVDILTKEFTWISKNDFLENSSNVFSAVENEELRTKLNKYFTDNLLTKLNKKKKTILDFSKKSKTLAMQKVVQEYPEVIDYYIKQKEEDQNVVLSGHVVSQEKVNFFEDTSVIQKQFQNTTLEKLTSVDDCISRIVFFKKVLESNSKSLKIKEVRLHEKQLQLMFKMVTYGSLFDYNSEVNNGRGPIDFIISLGSGDKIGLEFKLASNTKLKNNLKNQGDIYSNDSNLKLVIKVIFFFDDQELENINRILKELGKQVDNREMFLIDCRTKESASNVK